MTDLRVGLVGVSADGGWGREGHVPAIGAVDGLVLAAVAGRSLPSAQRAAQAVGASKAYGSIDELVADPGVDIVSVVSPVPTHRDLLLAALSAGKHVLTEWPVAAGLPDVELLASTAERSGRHAAVDLQARLSPAAQRARQLVANHRIGRVLNASVLSTTAGFGRSITEAQLALEDPDVGMNLLTIQTAHTVDLLLDVLGPWSWLQAVTTTRFPQVLVGSPPREVRRTLPDQVLLAARLADGAALDVQVVGGYPSDHTPFRMEVVGETGRLTVVGGGPRGFQASRLVVAVDDVEQPDEEDDSSSLPASVVNVARVYAALRDDIRHQTTTAPGFDSAVRLAHLVDTIRLAGERGGRFPTGTAEPHGSDRGGRRRPSRRP